MEKTTMVVVIVGLLVGAWMVLKSKKTPAKPTKGTGSTAETPAGPTDGFVPPSAALVDETTAFGGGVGGTVTEFLRADSTDDVK